MPVLPDRVDREAPDVAARRASLLALIGEHDRQLAIANLGGGEKYIERHRARGKLLAEPLIAKLAPAHGKTIGQVCLRWLIQQPMVAAVPRPLEEAHIEEDLDVFDFSLSEDEMRRMSALRSRRVRIANPPERAPTWDVETVG